MHGSALDTSWWNYPQEYNSADTQDLEPREQNLESGEQDLEPREQKLEPGKQDLEPREQDVDLENISRTLRTKSRI